MSMKVYTRRQLMSFKLPYDAEIEYLESTGTQYINSEITFVYDTDIIDISTNIAFTSNSERQLNGANGFLFWGINASGKFEVGQTAAGNYNSNFHSWELHCQKGQKVSAKIDNTTYYGSAAVDNRQTLYYIYLCALCSSTAPTGNPGFYAKQKIKRTTITKNGVLVRDFVPVRVGNVGYMYDKVSGKLFGNAGTGNFILGPDK